MDEESWRMLIIGMWGVGGKMWESVASVRER